MLASPEIVQKTFIRLFAFRAGRMYHVHFDGPPCARTWNSHVRVSKIDEVASVWENVLWIIPECLHACFEQRNAVVRQRGGRPLALRFDKQRERVGPVSQWTSTSCPRRARHATYRTRAAFTTVLSTPPAAETCAPTFHAEDTRGAKSDGVGVACVSLRRTVRARFGGPVSASSSV